MRLLRLLMMPEANGSLDTALIGTVIGMSFDILSG